MERKLRDSRSRSRSNGPGVLLVVTLLVAFTFCVSCKPDSQDVSQETPDGTVYENRVLGFSVRFPEDWKGRYVVKESEGSVSFFSKRVHDAYPNFGRLFTIERMIGELVTEEDMEQAPVPGKIVARGNGYTYLVRFPSDVQYLPGDEQLSRDYLGMYEQVSEVCGTLSLLPAGGPKAVNRGFKVVGSSFFTVEVPRTWDLKASQEAPLCWDVYSEGTVIGSIELVPYGTVKPAGDSRRQEYVSSESFRRTARIALDPRYADARRMKAIRESFRFVEGPFTVVDLLSNAERYLALGGTRVFGKIEGFDTQDGTPVAVRVRVMRLVGGEAGGEPADRPRIEDLNEIRTYPLDFGVYIAPLVPPHYRTYGTYEMFLLDEDFIERHPDYDEFFYDFIVGRAGDLKIVLGHYVPR